MKKLLIIALIVTFHGCDNPLENKVDDLEKQITDLSQTCRLVGDIDGDGEITNDCCEQTSCQNNPIVANSSCGEKPLGDVSIYAEIISRQNCNWWSDSTNASNVIWESPNTPCENYYWMDFHSNGELNIPALATFIYAVSVYPDTIYGIIFDANNPCYGKKLGEECCIPN